MRARHLLSLVAPAAVVTASFGGCGDVLTHPIGTAPGDASASSGSGSGSGGVTDARTEEATAPSDASSFCATSGPIPLPGTNQCTGDVERHFRFAACACNSLLASGSLTTDAFDSTSEAGPGSSDVASVAANEAVGTNASSNVGGSVWASGQSLPAGTPAVSLGGGGTIVHDVQSGGDVSVGGIYLVGGNLFANGNVTLASGGSLSVVGTVHQPAGDTATGVTAGGGIVHGPVSIAPPCDCSNPIDIAAFVSAHQSSNDDAAIGLSTKALDPPSGTVALPCGQYYLDAISGGAPSLDVQGRVALFVGGDLSAPGGLTITLGPGAEIDLFVAGNVDFQGTTQLGDVNAPARVRLYVGGATFTLAANAKVGANVYAPNATLQLASNFEMWGAVFARDLQFSGDFTIHYDTSVLQAAGCTPPGTPCKTCDDCSGTTPSCKGGTCTGCAADADCCAPLVCNTQTGRCHLPIQ